MKVAPLYALGGGAACYAAVALMKKNWESKTAYFVGVAGAIIFLSVGIYYDTPKTADEVIADNKKKSDEAKAKVAATGKDSAASPAVTVNSKA